MRVYLSEITIKMTKKEMLKSGLIKIKLKIEKRIKLLIKHLIVRYEIILDLRF